METVIPNLWSLLGSLADYGTEYSEEPEGDHDVDNPPYNPSLGMMEQVQGPVVGGSHRVLFVGVLRIGAALFLGPQ